jgi:2-oxoisovalerate dehydrogenase E1 component alpha subunit
VKLEVIRVMDDDGRVVHPEREPALSGDELRRLFRAISLVRVLDERMLTLQRQGRMGFYLGSLGEEATHIGATHALRDGDWLFPAYREAGAALYRGYPLPTFMCQLFGNAEDPVKGRQMPVHHSVRRINFVSVSSPVGSHIPHAVGAAWAAKLSKRDDIAVAFFGEGATSTPIFHTSANFAAVHKVPAILLCRNNGWAISVPRSMQTASATFAQKAVAYGMPGVLVDGNDILAMIHVVREAAARGRRGDGPTLIEALTYRRGSHSTSDDPSVYRDPAEVKEWERRDPLDRLRKYMQARGEFPDGFDATLRKESLDAIKEALAYAESRPPKPPLHSLFDDVYGQLTPRLREQRDFLDAEIAKHGPKVPPHGG